MRLSRTLNRDEVREVLDACQDYQDEKWEVQGNYPEWHPFQGNHEGKGESTGKTVKRGGTRMASHSQEKGKG
ncbi:MAG: hypothetical protein WC554_14020 [Clostridia bacterium]